MAHVKTGFFRATENQRIAMLAAGLGVFLFLLLASGIFLLFQIREPRCYLIQKPYTHAERRIADGNLLDCAVVNCRLKIGLSAHSAYTCYFRPARQPLPINPDELMELPVFSAP